MQFTAHTNRTIDGIGRVTAGKPFDVDPDAAAGLLGQCGPGGNFAPADDDARAALDAYTTAQPAVAEPAASTKPRKPRQSRTRAPRVEKES